MELKWNFEQYGLMHFCGSRAFVSAFICFYLSYGQRCSNTRLLMIHVSCTALVVFFLSE